MDNGPVLSRSALASGAFRSDNHPFAARFPSSVSSSPPSSLSSQQNAINRWLASPLFQFPLFHCEVHSRIELCHISLQCHQDSSWESCTDFIPETMIPNEQIDAALVAYQFIKNLPEVYETNAELKLSFQW